LKPPLGRSGGGRKGGCFVAPWHLRQLSAKKGATSFSKSTLVVERGSGREPKRRISKRKAIEIRLFHKSGNLTRKSWGFGAAGLRRGLRRSVDGGLHWMWGRKTQGVALPRGYISSSRLGLTSDFDDSQEEALLIYGDAGERSPGEGDLVDSIIGDMSEGVFLSGSRGDVGSALLSSCLSLARSSDCLDRYPLLPLFRESSLLTVDCPISAWPKPPLFML